MSTVGIYKLCWVDCPNYYIGQSRKLSRRKQDHPKLLRNGAHPNIRMQETFNRYGFPDFEIIVYCEEHELNDNERFYLQQAKGDPNCLNIDFDPLGFGRPVSEETRKKLSAFHKGRVHSESHRENVRKARLGGKNPNAKRVINTETLEVYKSASDLIRFGLVDMKYCTLKSVLSRAKTNYTPYIYLPSQKEQVELDQKNQNEKYDFEADKRRADMQVQLSN